MGDRYAIYFAPLAGSALARFGDSWLGRDAESGRALPQPALNGFDVGRLQELTEAPRHYGFHGTLKPPFQLADGCDVADLRRAILGFATRQRPFEIKALQLRAIGNFLALIPANAAPALTALADACVVEFDAYRAPPDAAELAGRHAAGLTPRQGELLARWGYPYVLDEFRFHLTLTGAIADAGERSRVADHMAPLVAPLTAQAVPVRELCLFHQPDRTAAFRLVERFPFGG
jgi:putative phosphonate metabolism protein